MNLISRRARMRRQSFAIAASLFLLVGSFASNRPAAAADEDTGPPLEEVVVTSRKTQESLLEVPVAVQAFTAKDIQEQGLTTLNDIAEFTPGFNINNEAAERNDRSFQTPIIRGMTPSVSSSTSPVSVYVDGSPTGIGFIEGVDDAERVEVLKGPQSAYFGRDTFGGAVNVITKDPSNTDKITATGLYGTDEWHDVRVTAEGPIVNDILAARFSVRSYAQTGQYTNNVDLSTNPGAPAKLGDQSTKSFSGTIVATPIEGLRIKAFGVYWEDKDGMPAQAKFNAQDYNCNAGAAPAGTLNYVCGTLPAYNLSRLAANVVIDPLLVKTVYENQSGQANLEIFNNSNDVNAGLYRKAFHWDVDVDYLIPALKATLTSLTSVNSMHYTTLVDFDNENTTNEPNGLYGILPDTEPFINWAVLVEEKDEDAAEDLRLVSDRDQRLRWTVGFSFDHRVYDQNVAGNAPFGMLANGGLLAPDYSTTYGEYFSLAFDIVKDLTFTVEGREQSDRIYTGTISQPVPGGPVTQTIAADTTFHNFLPRAILDWKVLPGIMLYTSASEGVNTGTFNNLSVYTPAQLSQIKALAGGPVGPVVQPEKLDDFELGIKGKFWDDRAQISADVYHMIWKNQIDEQILNIVGPTGPPSTANIGIYSNIGRTLLNGFELEGEVAPTDHWRANFAAAIAATKIDTHLFYNETADTLTGSPDVYGKQLSNYSKYTAALGIEYHAQFDANRKWYARGDYIYRSGQYDSDADLVKTPDTNRVNFRVGLRADHYFFEFFVLNAFDNRAYVSIESNSDILTSNQAVIAGMPLLRQEGFRASYSFSPQ